jgi:hypothetical protein
MNTHTWAKHILMHESRDIYYIIFGKALLLGPNFFKEKQENRKYPSHNI